MFGSFLQDAYTRRVEEALEQKKKEKTGTGGTAEERRARRRAFMAARQKEKEKQQQQANTSSSVIDSQSKKTDTSMQAPTLPVKGPMVTQPQVVRPELDVLEEKDKQKDKEPKNNNVTVADEADDDMFGDNFVDSMNNAALGRGTDTDTTDSEGPPCPLSFLLVSHIRHVTLY